ncbi:MAG: hypothetical protein QJR12_09510 [Mycobacterium sp.]|uniref:hypothetical protein n=1 Tax=Mycobacterium sp. TaxID=1785 RepID=UPI0026258CEE|nr:hypothetical protein [Mycobacterium sp.]MDI3314497.1 hypothetical protein [Mycobacterium sp.]
MSVSNVPAVVVVGTTTTPIPLPPVAAVWVLNSSGGLGDGPAPDVVVNQGDPASLDPQVGCRLKPGQFATLPMLDTYGHPMALSAIATGPGGQLEIELIENGGGWA